MEAALTQDVRRFKFVRERPSGAQPTPGCTAALVFLNCPFIIYLSLLLYLHHHHLLRLLVRQ